MLTDNPKFAQLCLLADECRDFLPKEGVYDFRVNALQAQLNWRKLHETVQFKAIMSPYNGETACLLKKVSKIVRLADRLEPLFWKHKEKLLQVEHAEHEAQQGRQMDFVSQQRQKDPDYGITQGD